MNSTPRQFKSLDNHGLYIGPWDNGPFQIQPLKQIWNIMYGSPRFINGQFNPLV